jgi:hypothetical protein
VLFAPSFIRKCTSGLVAMARALSPLETARRAAISRAIAEFKYRRGDDETTGTVCRLGIYPQLKNFTLRRTESGGVCMRLILKVRI